VLVGALAVFGFVVAPVAQATTNPWVDGPVTDYGSWDCGIYSTTGQLSLDPAVGETWIAYEGNPAPQTNSPYYIGVLYTSAGDSLQSNGSCAASQDVSLSLALPPGTSIDTSAGPIVCFMSGTQFTNGCPSASPSVRRWCWRLVASDRPGWVLGRRRADSHSPCRPVGLTWFCAVARRRPRIAGVT
jgi:hypothetical protein